MSNINYKQLYEEEKKKNEQLQLKIKELESKIQELSPKNIKKEYSSPEENNVAIIQRAFRRKLNSEALVNLGKFISIHSSERFFNIHFRKKIKRKKQNYS